MSDAGMKIDEITQLMFTNGCLLELMQGYCLGRASDDGEMGTLIPAFEILLSNHKKIQDYMDDIETDLFKNAYTDIFKK